MATTTRPRGRFSFSSGASPAPARPIPWPGSPANIPNADLVTLTGDALRQFHPGYRHLSHTDPLAVPNATSQATAAWVRDSIEHALTNRFSLMLEGTFRDAAIVSGTIRRFAAAGYRTHVVVLAVPAERSRLDCQLRYLDSDGVPGRWTPPSAHDTCYERLPTTLTVLEAVRELDQITISTRDGTDIYTNQRREDGRWLHPGRAYDALTTHRNQPMAGDEAAAWLQHYRQLVDRLHNGRHLDPRALPVHTRVHADAARVMAMADPFAPERPPHLDQHTADAPLPTDLLATSTGAPPADPLAPLAARAFPRLTTTADPTRPDAVPSAADIARTGPLRAR